MSLIPPELLQPVECTLYPQPLDVMALADWLEENGQDDLSQVLRMALEAGLPGPLVWFEALRVVEEFKCKAK